MECTSQLFGKLQMGAIGILFRFLKGFFVSICFLHSMSVFAGNVTQVIGVTTAILDVCAVGTGISTLDLGNVNPSLSTPISGEVTITVRCTNGYMYTLSVPSTGTLVKATDSLTFHAMLAGTTTGTGDGFNNVASDEFQLTISINATDYITAKGGSYTGNITISVN